MRAALLKITLVSIIGVAALSGCTTDQHKNTVNSKSYGQDGYMGLSNSNPNLPGSPGFHTYSKDTQLMNKTLNRIQGVRSHRIMLNGPHARVWLVVERGLSSAQKREIRAEALRQLRYNMPRYEIRLSLNNA